MNFQYFYIDFFRLPWGTTLYDSTADDFNPKHKNCVVGSVISIDTRMLYIIILISIIIVFYQPFYYYVVLLGFFFCVVDDVIWMMIYDDDDDDGK